MTQSYPFQQALPYEVDSSPLFNAIRKLPFACWLDSGKPSSEAGRYDIITALPSQRWVTHGDKTTNYNYRYNTFEKSDNISPPFTWQEDIIAETTQDPFLLLQRALSQLKKQTAESGNIALPFSGGLMGYFGYDLSRRYYALAETAPATCPLPDMAVGMYHWAIVQDHLYQKCWLVSLEECDTLIIGTIHEYLHDYLKTPAVEPRETFSISPLQSNTLSQQYDDKLSRISDYIKAGDCYQVNFSQCFSADYQGDPYIAYQQLRNKMASPFSAFISLGNQAIMSLSPERFIQTQGRQAQAQPIKGTIARGKDKYSDKEQADRLQNSAKNQAENLMIVDLLRNDLGKSCLPGSIKVPRLFSLASFPNVHHLVSTITGTIDKHKTSIDLFKHCFPGGSITGAPKKRAMEIIEELENCRRSVYCGSIAYINSHGDIDSNITIRTIACDGKKLHCWGGGGIVADSNNDEEYQESLTKINAILSALECFSQQLK